MAAVILDNLHFAYPPVIPGGSPVEVLRGVSFQIEAGQAVAIIGPTGSGKTTLGLVLAALAPAMTAGRLSGRALVDGQDVATTGAADLSTHLGMVFQEPERQLFNMTVAAEVAFGLEGLAMPRDQIGARVTWVLERMGLRGLEERPPWQLSGGQQKRLALATILAVRPPILFLDEPMAGLDPIGRREVADILTELRDMAGVTVIVAEKDAEFVARWADRLLVLAEGQILLDGPPAVLFSQVNRLQALGVAVPQIAELMVRLPDVGSHSLPMTAEEAAPILARRLPAGVPSSDPIPVGEPPAPTPPSPPALSMTGVSFRYEGGTLALEELSLAVPRGQWLALVGPNGSGKSTLARHLNGLLRPQAGTVMIHGRAVAGRTVGELSREVGYLFQNPDHQIFGTTVREEVAFGPRNLGLKGRVLAERVEEALSQFGLLDLAEVPPATLGYGLRRLVTVASLWAMRPSIWILDEPTTGLDHFFTRTLVSSLRDMHLMGHTVILITHDLRLVAEVAERVVVLDHGRVVLDGAPREVMADAGRLARFGLRPPPITRLSARLAPQGFPHPRLTVPEFVESWLVLS